MQNEKKIPVANQYYDCYINNAFSIKTKTVFNIDVIVVVIVSLSLCVCHYLTDTPNEEMKIALLSHLI